MEGDWEGGAHRDWGGALRRVPGGGASLVILGDGLEAAARLRSSRQRSRAISPLRRGPGPPPQLAQRPRRLQVGGEERETRRSCYSRGRSWAETRAAGRGRAGTGQRRGGRPWEPLRGGTRAAAVASLNRGWGSPRGAAKDCGRPRIAGPGGARDCGGSGRGGGGARRAAGHGAGLPALWRGVRTVETAPAGRAGPVGCCSGRCTPIFLRTFQLVTALERQVFDLLGHQWAPVLATSVHVVLVLLGLSGAVQYQPRCIVVYAVWAAVWVTWNVFITCFYLEVRGLSKDRELLTFDLSRHRSWWREHGPGGQQEGPAAGLGPPGGQALGPGVGCALEHGYVGALRSTLQTLEALVGFVAARHVVSVLTEEDDRCDFIGGLDPCPLHPATEKPSGLWFKQAHL
ncbi:sodium/potassium-transporting ATPase subunit beta-1-interacting protein 4 [Phyllostomus hastatus]|uniref:sodium/potassium-transporting ATPase subunit beta-1-interacting protein 4 n=1 Tax=Phyllostomus hastatus TaxID=9423 RepID=UPI001E683714|nr:sodium/potassium-transporting ATPase subunit beta-1-interacting protein 4 [Phyllostomus hastatus]